MITLNKTGKLFNPFISTVEVSKQDFSYFSICKIFMNHESSTIRELFTIVNSCTILFFNLIGPNNLFLYYFFTLKNPSFTL